MYQIKTLQEKQSAGYAEFGSKTVDVSLDSVVNRWLYEHSDIEIVDIQFFQGKYDTAEYDTAVIIYKPSEEQLKEIKEYQTEVDNRRYQAQHGFGNIRPDYIY